MGRMSSGKKTSTRHAFSLTEQLTEPSLNGIRRESRHKRETRSEVAESMPAEMCHSIYDEAKRQREEIEHDHVDGSLPKGSDLLAKSVRTALAK